jgi:hypothetical protein
MARAEPISQFIQSVCQLPQRDQDLILRTLRLLQNAPAGAQERARRMLREHVLLGEGDPRNVRVALEEILAYLSLHQSRREVAAIVAIGSGRDALI